MLEVYDYICCVLALRFEGGMECRFHDTLEEGMVSNAIVCIICHPECTDKEERQFGPLECVSMTMDRCTGISDHVLHDVLTVLTDLQSRRSYFYHAMFLLL